MLIWSIYYRLRPYGLIREIERWWRKPLTAQLELWRRDVDLQQVIEQFRAACNDFARGEPEPIKAIYSHADDATLANPFGPPVRGWEKVSQLLDYASSRFRDGEVTKWERIAEYATPDLVTMLEMERWVMKVGGREQAASIDLRVTSTFRREDGAWKLVSRHADPISTFDSDGPMRAMGG